MKKISLKRLLSAGLVLVMLLGALGVTAFAGSLMTPNVVYNGNTRKVEFENALLPFFSGSEEPDLFVDLKDMMPGDSVTQNITVGVKNIGADTVKMYLRTENENEHYQKLMSEEYADWINFAVKQGDKVLAEGDLSEGVMLGEFRNDGKTDLTVTLAIALEAGNDLQGLVASVDWVFTAEVIPYVYDTDDLLPEADIPWLTRDHVNYIMGYDDGTVRPNDPITRAEVATILFRLLTEEAREEFWATSCEYPDVEGSNWFNVAVSTLTNAGIIEGYNDGKFRPNEEITRAELATMLARFDRTFGSIETSAEFPDIKGHWAEEYIEHAATRGWVLGYKDGKFRPDRNITRAETVTMINRVLERAVNYDGMIRGCVDWSDNYATSWYYYDMLEAGNYHDHGHSGTFVEHQNYLYERWTALHEPIDWAAMEDEWVARYGN